MASITTEAQLDDLQNDPERLKDYIRGVVAESASGVEETIKSAVGDAVSASGIAAKRLPQSDESAALADVEPGITKGSWLGGDTLGRGSSLSEAKGLNGQFKHFGEFLQKIHPMVQQRAGMDARLKVLGEGQGDQGGFLVPEQFTTNIMALALENAVVRPRAFVMPMAAPTVTIPSVRSTTHASNVFGGVQAYWTPEHGTITASEPSFSRIVLNAKKLTLYTSASNELLADSAVGLEALLSRMYAEAISYFEDDGFINGSGAGDPIGILNANALVTVAKETGQAAATIVSANIDKMWSRLLPQSKANAIWLVHPDTFPQLAALSRTVGTGGSAVFVSNMASNAPASIYGRPIIESEKCQTLGTAGDIFLVDLSYYVVGDRQAVTMAASPHVRFQQDEMVWRMTSRIDGKPWIDSALTPRNGSNTLSAFVNLATRS